MKIDKNNFSQYKKLNFLITGATGSFGQKFIEVLQKIVKPKKEREVLKEIKVKLKVLLQFVVLLLMTSRYPFLNILSLIDH